MRIPWNFNAVFQQSSWTVVLRMQVGHGTHFVYIVLQVVAFREEALGEDWSLYHHPRLFGAFRLGVFAGFRFPKQGFLIPKPSPSSDKPSGVVASLQVGHHGWPCFLWAFHFWQLLLWFVSAGAVTTDVTPKKGIY
jgi:hypothetical protein